MKITDFYSEEAIVSLALQVKRQVGLWWGDSDGGKDVTGDQVAIALSRAQKCFQIAANKYYHNPENPENPVFDTLHSGQYAIFLYYLANSVWHSFHQGELATKIYYLNKIMHAVDWYYEIDLPGYFDVEHPVSSVLGRAKYGDGLFLYQGTTVGGNGNHYPVIGKNCILFSHASILGKCHIGDNVMISTGVTLLDQAVPDNSIVFGTKSPDITIKSQNEAQMQERLRLFWTK